MKSPLLILCILSATYFSYVIIGTFAPHGHTGFVLISVWGSIMMPLIGPWAAYLSHYPLLVRNRGNIAIIIASALISIWWTQNPFLGAIILVLGALCISILPTNKQKYPNTAKAV